MAEITFAIAGAIFLFAVALSHYWDTSGSFIVRVLVSLSKTVQFASAVGILLLGLYIFYLVFFKEVIHG